MCRFVGGQHTSHFRWRRIDKGLMVRSHGKYHRGAAILSPDGTPLAVARALLIAPRGE